MLVATPQTSSYALHGSSNTKQTCRAASATPKSSTSNCQKSINAHKAMTTKATTSSATPAAPTSAASSLMKTLSVRLNRGTEFLKGTVQRALISATSSVASTTVTNAAAVADSSVVAAASATNLTAVNVSKNTIASAATASATLSQLFSKQTVPTASFLKVYTVLPTNLHRHPEEREQTGSADSLHHEVCHFKPIRSAPTTARKSGSRSRGASLKAPKACLAKRVLENPNCDDPSDAYHYSPNQRAASLFVSATSGRHRRSAFVYTSGTPAPVPAPAKRRQAKRPKRAACNRRNVKSKRSRRTKSTKAAVTPAAAAAPLKERHQIAATTRSRGQMPQSLLSLVSLTSLDTHTPGSKFGLGNASSIIDIMALAQQNKKRTVQEDKLLTQTQAMPASRLRKRKLDDNVIETVDVGSEEDGPRLGKRKSVRLLRDCNQMPQGRQRLGITAAAACAGRQSQLSSAASDRATPPLTRSRLRQMSQLKLLSALEFQRRPK